jgi:hypothetical protein
LIYGSLINLVSIQYLDSTNPMQEIQLYPCAIAKRSQRVFLLARPVHGEAGAATALPAKSRPGTDRTT